MSEVVFVDGQTRIKETQDKHPNEKRVDKALYIILAVFLGNFGVHHFYAGKKKKGILYLIFCWTLIPEILTLFDVIRAFGKMKDPENKIWI
ncbi:MAG: TM2 domain-containing protein [Ruminiclostridium sp.]|nr:TM2 domain-containing protein [Ruminiclostridium sp.]